MIKKFKGRHIDLTKIVCISDVALRTYNYTYLMEFYVYIQLLDAPINFIEHPISKLDTKNENDIEFRYSIDNIPTYKHIDGEFKIITRDSKLVCMDRFQKEVDQLIEDWKKAIGQ